MSVEIPILCFNDVYRVSQRYVPQPGAPISTASSSASNGTDTGAGRDKDKREPGEIHVSQFGKLIYSLRDQWADSPLASSSSSSSSNSVSEQGTEGQERGKEGLVLFAGDVFNPSVESSVTRGSHMVPIMNALKVDCACVGNHDFDFGFPHLTKLIHATTFPWLLSNIVDTKTNFVPEPLKRYWVTEKCGVRIGVIGLVEQDWIATIPSWPETFQYRSMVDTALELSQELRDPKGKEKVDIVIALTHCRIPNDIKLANELGAVANTDEGKHGVDLVIGGHDHVYYIGKGASSWEGYPGDRDAPGTEGDQGVRLIKSGTDFRDLSSATLTLSSPATNSNKARRRTIKDLKGKHHYIIPSSPYSDSMSSLTRSLLSTVSTTLSKPVCFSLTPFDARSEVVRTRETGLGNWVADVLMHAYAESLLEKGSEEDQKVSKRDRRRDGGVDAVIICGGTLRGDSQYGPGKITLGDILEILPFEDSVVCIEMDGKGIWDTMESALSKWPAQEGRFPIISGLQVEWDHTLPPNQRVKSIRVVNPPKEEDDEIENPEDLVDFVEGMDGTRIEVKQRKVDLGEAIKREEGGRVYRIITRDYMAQGYDGFEAMKNRKFIIDDENGQIMSSIIRSFLLGSAYIFRHKQLVSAHETHLSSRSNQVISKARAQHRSNSTSTSPTNSPRSSKLGLKSPIIERDEYIPTGALASPISETSGVMSPGGTPLKRHIVEHGWSAIRAALWIAKHEHMSEVDDCEGHNMRHSGDIPPHAHSAICQPLPPIAEVSSSKSEPKRNDVTTAGDAHLAHQSQQNPPEPKTPARGSYFVNEQNRDELKSLESELAIVCPLIDGRMKDLAVKD